MKKFRVFIHTNEAQILGAKIAGYSFKRNSRTPERFDVELIELKNYPDLLIREGQPYLRKGRMVKWRNRDLQSFSPLRFLPPQIMKFQGRAIVTDPDVFAVGDICELFDHDMQGKSILARHVTEGKYTKRSDFYATSVMLLDCGKLTHWHWNQKISAMFEGQFDYGDWIGLKSEDPRTIGNLEERWNSFDTLNESTKLLHLTERITQPWKTGLARDFNMTGEPSFRIGSKVISPLYLARRIEGRLWGASKKSDRFYQPHPDRRQETFFLSLAQEALEKGILTTHLINDQIAKRHVRNDLLKLIQEPLPVFHSEVKDEIRL